MRLLSEPLALMRKMKRRFSALHYLIAFVLITFYSTHVLASTTVATLKKAHKGSVISAADNLASIDGNVDVLLPDKRGTTVAVYAFNPQSLSPVAGSRLVIGVFEQAPVNYKISISGATQRWIGLEPGLVCATYPVCGSFVSSVDLAGTLSDYMRGSQVLIKIELRNTLESRLVLDTMLIEQGGFSPDDPEPPVNAVSDSTSTTQGTPVSIAVLENDLGATGVIDRVTEPSFGTATINGSNIVYTPDDGFTGADEFRYYVSDSSGATDSARIRVEVMAAVDDGPDPLVKFRPGSSLYWQLQGPVVRSYPADVFGIDLEDNENNGLVQSLKSSGIRVICYFSAGSFEDWRSDKNEFDLENDLGNPLGDWPGEYYLDTNSDNVRRIMRLRMDRAVAAGCDAVEPDNTDAYQANSGLGISSAEQVDYLRFLANTAHARGLSIGLKNTVGLIADNNLADLFDWTLNESCYLYNECDTLKPFIAQGKAVYIAMYSTRSLSSRCADAANNNFHLAFYGSDYALDGNFYRTCD